MVLVVKSEDKKFQFQEFFAHLRIIFNEIYSLINEIYNVIVEVIKITKYEIWHVITFPNFF